MKEMIHYGIVLALICTIAAGLLAGANSLTKSKIIEQREAEEASSLQEVMPQAAVFNPVKKGTETIYYKCFDKDGKFVGAVFKAYGDGYSSTIETMAGILRNGTITSIKILAQNETPGLGTRVNEPSFREQFSNKNLEGLDGVQAIAGATISSTAVMESVEEKAKDIYRLIKDEK